MTSRHLSLALFCIMCCAMAMASSGCEEDPSTTPTRRATQAAAQSGPWDIPSSVEAIGNAQFVMYDSAGAWNGGAGCSGGMTTGASQLRDFLLSNFAQISNIGGYNCRQNTGNTSLLSVHGTGRALDIHIPLDGGEADNDLGDAVANWLVENSESIGVQYIIWDRWRWHSGRPAGEKSASYGGPHPHHDHLHIEITHEAAARQTEWFQGPATPVEPPPPELPPTCDAGTAYDPPFCDDDGHWAETSINTIEAAGVTQGCGETNNKRRYCTHDDAIRAHTIVMLARASNMPLQGHPDVFTDMAGYESMIPYANAAHALGVTTGCGPESFCPGDSLTRSQIAAFLSRAYALPAATEDHFDDDEGSIFEGDHNKLYEAGLTVGCGDRMFCGDDIVSRAVLAVFLARALDMGLTPAWAPSPDPTPGEDTDPDEDPTMDPPEMDPDPTSDANPPAEDTSSAADMTVGSDTTTSPPAEDTSSTAADTSSGGGDDTRGGGGTDASTSGDTSAADASIEVGATSAGCGCVTRRGEPGGNGHAPLWMGGALIAGWWLRRRRR